MRVVLILTLTLFYARADAQSSMSKILSLEGINANNIDYINKAKARYARDYNSFSGTKLGLLKYFEQKFIAAGMPPELKNISIIESYLNLQAVSVVGAGGLWQIMPATGRELGLTIDGGIDHRFDVYKSTDAAIDHIKDLYRQYNDWMLVLAAYNAGSGRVNSAIKSAGSRNIWHLEPFLPLETNLYVKKFIATTLAWGNANRSIGPVPYPAAPEPPVISTSSTEDKKPEVDYKEVRLNAKGLSYEKVNAGIRLDVIAEHLDMTVKAVRSLNKNFEKELNKNGTASLVLPGDKMADFLFKKGTIIRESLKKNMLEATN